MNEKSKPHRRPGRPRDSAADRAILDAGLELFLAAGIEGANIEQIARRSGVSRATIYRRWSNSADIIAEALVRARKPPPGRPETVRDMSASELGRFLLNEIVRGLARPESGMLAERLLGAMLTHPTLLATYRDIFVEPWRRACLDAIRRAGIASQKSDADIVVDILIGAAVHHIVMRDEPIDIVRERAWARAVLDRLGFVVAEE